jgi:uncharacterized protein YcfJ
MSLLVSLLWVGGFRPVGRGRGRGAATGGGSPGGGTAGNQLIQI